QTGLALVRPVRVRSSPRTCESVPPVISRCIGRRSTAGVMSSPLARWSSPTPTNGSTVLPHDKRRSQREKRMERSVEVLAIILFGVVGFSHILQPRAWTEFFILLRGKGEAGAFVDGF